MLMRMLQQKGEDWRCLGERGTTGAMSLSRQEEAGSSVQVGRLQDSWFRVAGGKAVSYKGCGRREVGRCGGERLWRFSPDYLDEGRKASKVIWEWGRGAGVFQGLNSHLKCPKRGHPFHLAILFLLCKFSRKHLSYFAELSSHSFEILFWNPRYLLQWVPKNLVFLSFVFFFYVTEKTTER